MGSRSGKATWYYEDGKLKEEATYINDKLSGMLNYYYEDGALQEATKFWNDKRVDTGKTYYENGKIKIFSFYTHGFLDSTRNCDEKGRVIE
jgi:antitoxin component YwqK of YwqJK toxin-antitoxin module